MNNPATISVVWVWFWIALITLPILALACWKRIYPHVPLLIALAVPCFASPLLLAWPYLFPVIMAIDGVVALAALYDLFTFPSPQAFAVERETLGIASLKATHSVTLHVSNQTPTPIAVWIRDDVPQEFQPSVEEFGVQLAARSRSTMHYELKSSRRGRFTLEYVYLRVRSKYALWQRFFKYPAVSQINVYPDMKQLSEYALLARTNRLSLLGVRRTRKIGQDNEFERLRDYTLDDNFKHIDWRSTARRNKLTVKDFQTSQSQRIVFLIDCGRMMTNETSGLSLLDHALNSMLMLSHVALKQGDSVGLVCFSDQVHAYVPPRGGMNQMNQLLHASFDRFPKLVESRYDEAFLYLASHCKKRSLVVLMTNLIDEVNAHQVHSYLAQQVGRHLPLAVLLRDHHLFDAADVVAPRNEQFYQAAAAAEILTWRHHVLRDLEHKGVLCLDVFPEDMTAPMVNLYLNVKARHLL